MQRIATKQFVFIICDLPIFLYSKTLREIEQSIKILATAMGNSVLEKGLT